MREIKFRIWSKETKTMLYYEQHPVPCMTLNGVLCGENHTNVSYMYELMQFTGLKDKNGQGKEVYFDDIAKDEHGQVFVVEWDYPLLARLQEIWFEVVGNIHSNPELLEAKE